MSAPEKLAEGTLLSHLLELRERLMRMVIAVVVIFVPCAYYSNRIFEYLDLPVEIGERPDPIDLDRSELRALAQAIAEHRLGQKGQDLSHIGVIDTQHGRPIEGQPVGELDKGLLQAREVMPVGIHVVCIDIGDHGDHR